MPGVAEGSENSPTGKIGTGVTMEKGDEINPGKQIRRFTSHAKQEAETMRYWRDRPASEKMTVVTELAEYAYRMRGIDVHAQGPKGPVVRVQRERR